MECSICERLAAAIAKESDNANEIGAERRKDLKSANWKTIDLEMMRNLTYAQTDCNNQIHQLITQLDAHLKTHSLIVE